jgi:hypothetical protein
MLFVSDLGIRSTDPVSLDEHWTPALYDLGASDSGQQSESESESESDPSDQEIEEHELSFGHLPHIEPVTLVETHIPSPDRIP